MIAGRAIYTAGLSALLILTRHLCKVPTSGNSTKMLADRGCQLYKNALSEENRKERSQRVLSVNANGS